MDNQHLNRSNQSGLAAFKASLFFKIIDWCLIYSMVFLCITVDTLAYSHSVRAAELPPNIELTQLIQIGSSTQTSVKRITRSDFDFTYTLNISYIGATPDTTSQRPSDQPQPLHANHRRRHRFRQPDAGPNPHRQGHLYHSPGPVQTVRPLRPQMELYL